MTDRRINGKSFIKITNRDIWDMINKVDGNIEKIKLEIEKITSTLMNHIEEDNKRFSNIKWFAGILITVLTVVFSITFGLITKFL